MLIPLEVRGLLHAIVELSGARGMTAASQKRIAEMVGRTPSTITRLTKEAEALGLLQVVRRKNRETNVYRVLPPVQPRGVVPDQGGMGATTEVASVPLEKTQEEEGIYKQPILLGKKEISSSSRTSTATGTTSQEHHPGFRRLTDLQNNLQLPTQEPMGDIPPGDRVAPKLEPLEPIVTPAHRVLDHMRDGYRRALGREMPRRGGLAIVKQALEAWDEDDLTLAIDFLYDTYAGDYRGHLRGVESLGLPWLWNLLIDEAYEAEELAEIAATFTPEERATFGLPPLDDDDDEDDDEDDGEDD